MIVGYKCFNKNLINRYGTQFQVGSIYHATGEIKYGSHGNGFHMCKNLEDTLRYFDAMNDEVEFCIVSGFGEIVEYSDDYNEYYNLYSCEHLYINRLLKREEIIKMMLDVNVSRAVRFVSQFRLTDDEIELFREKYSYSNKVGNAIMYYQKGDKYIYHIDPLINGKDFLFKLLTSDKIKEDIENNMDVLLKLIPEIKSMIGFDQKNPNHHLDIWNHTLMALSISKNDFEVRLVLLLHDIGKPFSYQEENNIRHFNNHPTVSSEMAKKILMRLDFNKEFIDRICYLVKKHDDVITEDDIKEDYILNIKRCEI